MTTIKNASLAGERLTTQYGVYIFDANGIAEVPDELAQKLITIQGFTIVDKPADEPSNDSVTLEGGVVWTKIDEGYVVNNNAVIFTITGSGVDSDNLPPNNVTLQSDVLLFDASINVSDVHVKGVTAGESIQIGDNKYTWEDIDGNTDNGYELKIIDPYQPLPGGGKYIPIEGGYNLVDDTGVSFTVLGDNLDTAHVSIQNGQLVVSSGANLEELLILGVKENDTIQIGDDTYKWVVATPGEPEKGLKLEYVPPIESLPGGGSYYAIEGGYLLFDDTGTTFTVFGDQLDTEHISVAEGRLVLQEGVDIDAIRVLGVSNESTIQIGNDTYKWINVDDNPNSGYKLELVQEVYTLEGGGKYIALSNGGYKLFDDTASYSIVSGDFDIDHISVQNGQLVLSEGINVNNVHILGVKENDTIQIGDDTYKWVNADNDATNGLELEHINEFTDLPNGGSYAVIEGKFVITDGKETFTLVLGTLDVDHIGVKNGKLMIFPGVDVDSIHVVGVAPGDTIQIGDDIYEWSDTDINSEGCELVLLPKPNWQKTEQGVIYQKGDVNYTLSGSAVNFDDAINAPLNVSVIGGALKFDPNIDVANLSVLGVKENDTIQIGDDTYKWVNADNDATNGLELVIVTTPEPEPEEPDSFEYNFDGKTFTVEGGMNSSLTVEQLNANVSFDKSGNLTIGKDIISSINGVHLQGLESGAVVNVDGENYTLIDADNNLDNGYELVGGTDDMFDWKWSNRNKPINPQIWRHYTNDTPDIKVQGVSARPNYNQQAQVLTLMGDEISSITNSTGTTLKLAGDLSGILSNGSMFSLKNGLVANDTESYVYLDGILYVPNGSISGLSGELEFTLVDKKLTITSGNLNTDIALVAGSAIGAVSVSNKNFLVSGNKLVKNAFSKRRSIKR